MAGEDTFMKITNKDIYDKVEALEVSTRESHKEICEHLITTNGKVKLNKWIGTTAITLVIVLLGFLVNHILKS